MFYEKEGRRLHYISTGSSEKPLLIFVHGSPGSWDAFKSYLTDQRLLERYQLIAIDRPGFGYSDFGEVMNLSDQAALIDSFIHSIADGRKVILAGHSLGGPLVLKLATLRSETYHHLVVIAGSVDPDAENPERWRPVIGAFPLRFLIPGALRPSNDELWLLKTDLKELAPQLRRVVSPVTIIHGSKDRLVPFSNAAFMETSLVHAASVNLEIFPGADHFIVWTDYERIRDILLKIPD